MVRRSRSALLATLLAFFAVLGMAALSGWHGASYHLDEPAHAVAAPGNHDHADHAGSAGHDGADDVMHIAAHAIGTAIAVPHGALPALPGARFVPAFPAANMLACDGLDPTSLLRPPRA